ncbi:MAG: peptidylprolyl isomerase [Christensenellales bacterium]
MKKALITVIAFLLLFSFCACSAGEFISASKLEKIKEKSGIDANPVATLTLRYTDINEESRGEVYTVVIEYELLIDKAPITVINFMNLIQQGFYDNTVVDYIGERYLIAGRYSEEDDKFITKESVTRLRASFLPTASRLTKAKRTGTTRSLCWAV